MCSLYNGEGRAQRKTFSKILDQKNNYPRIYICEFELTPKVLKFTNSSDFKFPFGS